MSRYIAKYMKQKNVKMTYNLKRMEYIIYKHICGPNVHLVLRTAGAGRGLLFSWANSPTMQSDDSSVFNCGYV
jgi:hypothetical protein